ncbi:glutathione S-transferase [Pelagibius sp.]|uniref:glutathione S-transferase n=1 Tax=Pelagibius sp. TaxID=1931238 RepID=UPI003BAF1802
MQYKLVMGNRVYSGWSLRAWLVLRQTRHEFQHEVVPLYTEEFDLFRKECFPARQLPALIATEGDTRRIIWDSLSITEFLSERHPDAGLWPEDASMRAAARSLCAEMHSGFKALRAKMPVNLKRHYKSFSPDDETLADIRRICDLWKWAWAESDGEGAYLFGERFTAADAFFAPVVSRFRTYSIDLDDLSNAYCDLLLRHPATAEFIEAAQSETWVMEHNEFNSE